MKLLISVIEYLISVVMLLGGVILLLNYDAESMFEASPIVMLIFSSAFIVCGVGTIYGKITSHRKVHTAMLMLMYITNTFGTIIDFIAWGADSGLWIDTAIIGGIAAACWLYWRYRYTKYGN